MGGLVICFKAVLQFGKQSLKAARLTAEEGKGGRQSQKKLKRGTKVFCFFARGPGRCWFYFETGTTQALI